MVRLCCAQSVYNSGILIDDKEVETHVNRYTTTLHAINSAIVKLSKLTRVSKVFRGVSNRALPVHLLTPNDFGVKGGIESSFMSTTTDKGVAVRYSKALPHVGGSAPEGARLIFEIQQGMIDRGANVKWLSQCNTSISDPHLSVLKRS